MIYLQLLRFLLPLVLTIVVQELSGQLLTGGMARAPEATATLAGFGLAWGLVSFLSSALSQTKQLGLVLVDGRPALRKAQGFVLGFGLLLAAVLAGLTGGPLSTWVIEGLHGVSAPLSGTVRTALFWFIPIPIISGLALFYAGLLIRVRRTGLISSATLANIVVSVLTVLVLLPTPFIQAQPIRLPLVVVYAGVLVELVVMWWGYRRHVWPRLTDTDPGGLTLAYIARFFWPLALIMIIQGMSRPLINLFIAREPGGTEALAVLTVIYTLAHLPYGWLNEIRNLAPAFRDRPENLGHIRRFALGCGFFSFGLMVGMFWTPLRGYILETLLGLNPSLATQAAVPLVIFTFFPLAVMGRAYLHGVGLVEHRTQAMAPSAPARVVAILIALALLQAAGVHGAPRAVAALLSGFVLETVVVWWGVRGRQRFRQAQLWRPAAR